MKKIQIKCTGSAFIKLENIKNFQGNLKKRSDNHLKQIKTSILKYGFSFPFFIWLQGKNNWCLDGHGRIEGLKALQEEGYDIPELPIVYIKAKDRNQAKQKLLRMNSHYGEFDIEGLNDFADGLVVDWDELNLPKIKEFNLSADHIGGKYEREEESKDSVIYELKLLSRALAVLQSEKIKSIELFSGRGKLTEFYKRYFKKNITSDMKKYQEKQDFAMSANDFIDKELLKNIDFNFIDFDDEGTPAESIQKFFEKIKCKKKEVFYLCLTDGNGVNFCIKGKVNMYKTYLQGENKVVKVTDQYQMFTKIVDDFIKIVSKKNSFISKKICGYLNKGKKVYYASYKIKPV